MARPPRRPLASARADQRQAGATDEDALRAAGAARIEAYLDVFFTGDGPRAPPPRPPRAFAPARRRISPRIDPEAPLRLGPILDPRRKAVALRDRSQALMTIASEVARRYRARKGSSRAARL